MSVLDVDVIPEIKRRGQLLEQARTALRGSNHQLARRLVAEADQLGAVARARLTARQERIR